LLVLSQHSLEIKVTPETNIYLRIENYNKNRPTNGNVIISSKYCCCIDPSILFWAKIWLPLKGGSHTKIKVGFTSSMLNTQRPHQSGVGKINTIDCHAQSISSIHPPCETLLYGLCLVHRSLSLMVSYCQVGRAVAGLRLAGLLFSFPFH